MIFDTHAHVLSANLDRYPYSSLRGGKKAPVSPMVFPVENLIQKLDAANVSYACVVQRATLYGYDNSYTLDATAAHPDRLVSVLVLDAQNPASLQQLRLLAAQRKLGGLRIVAPDLSEQNTDWLCGQAALNLWRTAAELNLPVTVILYRMNNAAGLAGLSDIAREITDIPIIIDHVGVPHGSTPEIRWSATQGIEYEIPGPPDFGINNSLAPFEKLEHVHFKVTDINYDRLQDAHLNSADFVRELADRFGSSRLLWGSDIGQSPAPYTEKTERLHASARLLNKQERADFLGNTAFRLYGAALS